MEQYYAENPEKGNLKTMFNTLYPTGKNNKGYVYIEDDAGDYKAVDYDVESAEGRVRLALDQTANETEKKMLKSKLKDARLADWVTKNPKKNTESDVQYASRAKKAGF